MTTPSSFSPFLAELNTLASIPPNTYFHRNRKGHFMTTADFASTILCAQTIANTYKGRDPAATASQITKFSKKLQVLISTETETALESNNEILCRKTFRQLIFVCQRIHYAIRGRVEGGGLTGVFKTYENHGDAKEVIETAISNMRESALNALKALRDQLPEKKMLGNEQLNSLTTYTFEPEEKPICPEENYTDEEWEAAIAHSADLLKESVGMMHYYGRYSTGLFYNQARSYLSDSGWEWMNKIGHFENGNLYLSALPVVSKNMDSLEDLKKAEISAVLSVTEVFETHSDGYFTSPIKPSTYAKNGIKHLQIPTPDCETIFFELVLRGVEFIHWCLSKGVSIDVHCKAGRGRSFMIVVCYLIKYQNMTANAAFEHVSLMRPQSGFSKNRQEWKTIEVFEKFYYKPST